MAKSRSIFEMGSISSCMSSFSWMVVVFFGFTSTWILLKPSLWEFFILFLVDTLLGIQINKYFEAQFFIKLFPEASLYFFGLQEKRISSLSKLEKIQLLESLVKFPIRRAVYFCSWGLLKMIPGFLIIIYYWKHQLSNKDQFLMALGICLINVSSIFGAILFHSHIFISKQIETIHFKEDWSDIFDQVNIKRQKSNLTLYGLISLICVFLFVLSLQWAIITTYQGHNFDQLAFQCLSVGLIGLMLFAHNWLLSSQMIDKELLKIMGAFKFIHHQQGPQSLALHTLPILAMFQKTFNSLIKKLSASEQELSSLVCQETEKSRFRALGEISALIAHDLAGPLHVAQFCYKEIAQTPQMAIAIDPSYLERLGLNIKRAIELVESLRAKIKNKNMSEKSSGFSNVHSQVMVLLGTQYYSHDFNSIKFELDPHLSSLKLALTQVDLIHILDNLYRNSIQHLLDNEIRPAVIKITLHSFDDSKDKVQILISDNGLGMSKDMFEELTSFYFTQKNFHHYQSGIGLRLTRRLIELNKGSLTIVDNHTITGTQFLLTLPLQKEGQIQKEAVSVEEEIFTFKSSERNSDESNRYIQY